MQFALVDAALGGPNEESLRFEHVHLQRFGRRRSWSRVRGHPTHSPKVSLRDVVVMTLLIICMNASVPLRTFELLIVPFRSVLIGPFPMTKLIVDDHWTSIID